jgi:hypothetical protein
LLQLRVTQHKQTFPGMFRHPGARRVRGEGAVRIVKICSITCRGGASPCFSRPEECDKHHLPNRYLRVIVAGVVYTRPF